MLYRGILRMDHRASGQEVPGSPGGVPTDGRTCNFFTVALPLTVYPPEVEALAP